MNNNKTYCYHCFAVIEKPNSPYCPMCGKQYKVHYHQSNELPAGSFLSGGRYFVGESIGSGGFGITYIGFDTRLNKRVLIKETFYSGLFQRNTFDLSKPDPLEVTYRSDISLDEIISKTEKECLHLSEGEGLENIVKVYDFFSENNTAYIITEFIDGITLYDRVNSSGHYNWNDLYDKILPLMQSLMLLHKRRILHRDIKPQNIMIRKNLKNEEQFVLIDFGLARSTSAKTLASIGTAFSPGYAPFEQRAHLNKDGTYTDVYSLAATIYFALTGKEPTERLSENTEDNFPLLAVLSSDYGVPKKSVDALRSALETQYGSRCQTMDTFIDNFTINPNEKQTSDSNIPVINNTTYNTGQLSVNFFSPYDSDIQNPPTAQLSDNTDYVNIINSENENKGFPKTAVFAAIGFLIVGIAAAAVFFYPRLISPGDSGTNNKFSLNSGQDFKYTYSTKNKNSSNTDTEFYSDVDTESTSNVVMPSFVGKDLSDASDFLTAEGIIYSKKHEYSSTYKKNIIISQSPSPGTILMPTDEVILTISKGKKPDKTNSNVSSKTTSSKSENNDEKEPENKKDNKPESKPDKKVENYTESKPVVSSPPKKSTVNVPNIVGMNYHDAINLLTSNNINSSGSSVFSDTVAKDVVISQNPAPNTEIDPHSTITFTYSAGPQTTIKHTTTTEPDTPPDNNSSQIDNKAESRHNAMINIVNQSKANCYTIGKLSGSDSNFLFVETGEFEAEKAFVVYEIKEDNAYYVTEIGAGHTSFYLDSTTQTLGNYTGYMGFYSFGLLEYDDGYIYMPNTTAGIVAYGEDMPSPPGTSIEMTSKSDYSLIYKY